MAIPFTTIILDKPRRLRFGMAAMCEFEQTTGLTLKDLDDDLTMDVASKILWSMLRQDEPDLTLEAVTKLVDEHADSLTSVMNAVGDAISLAFLAQGEQRPNAKAPTAKPPAGKGTRVTGVSTSPKSSR